MKTKKILSGILFCLLFLSLSLFFCLSAKTEAAEAFGEKVITFEIENDKDYFVKALGASKEWSVKEGKFYSDSWAKTALNIAVPTAGEKYISLDFCVQNDAFFLVGFLKDVNAANHGVDYSLVFNPTNKSTYVYRGSLSQTTWQASAAVNFCDGQEHNLVIKVKDGVISYAIDGTALYTDKVFDGYKTDGTEYIYLALESSTVTTSIDNVKFSKLAPSAEIAGSQSITFEIENDKDYFVKALGASKEWSVKEGKFRADSWAKTALNIAVPTAGEKYISLDFCVQNDAYFLVGFLKDVNAANHDVDYSLVFNPSNKSTYVYRGSLSQATWQASAAVNFCDGQEHNLVIKVKDGVISYAIDGTALYTDKVFDGYKTDGTEYIYLALESSTVTTSIDNVEFCGENPAEYKVDFEMTGASIRLYGETGMRFQTVVSKNDKIEIVREGTLIMPQRLLNEELTLFTADVLDIPAKNYYYGDEASATHCFTGVLTKIPESRYNEDITARAYVVYKRLNSDIEVVSYSAAVTRSVSYVAERALESGECTERERQLLKGILAKASGDITLEDFDEYAPDYAFTGEVRVSTEKVASDMGNGLRVTPLSAGKKHSVTVNFGKTDRSNKSYLRIFMRNSGLSALDFSLTGINESDFDIRPVITDKEGKTADSVFAGFEGYLAWEIPEGVTELSSVTFGGNAGEEYIYYTLDSIVLTDNVYGNLFEAQKTIVQQKRQIENILDAALYKKVQTKEETEYSPSSLAGYEHIKAITYDGISFGNGRTKVFAYVGFPLGASKDSPVPAMVLVHGGGGHPYLQWVKAWNDRGYAAIAMETTGCFPKKGNVCINESDNDNFVYGLGSNPDFQEDGYVDSLRREFPVSYAEIDKHWAIYGLTCVEYAHNILRADERVDSEKIGITGVSWGGVTASLAIGYDTRYAFAVPVYGTAYLGGEMHSFDKFGNEYVHALWAAEDRLDNFKNPVMWWAYNDDNNFAVPAYVNSYVHSVRNNEKDVLVMLGNWSHSHGSVFYYENEYSAVFADSVVKGGAGFVRFGNQPSGGEINCALVVPEGAVVTGATVYYITEKMTYTVFDKFGWGNAYPFLTQTWQTSSTAVTVTEDGRLTGSIPEDVKGYYVNVEFSIGGVNSQVSSVFTEII